MAQFHRLHDLYSFPGFKPNGFVRGVFGDAHAVVVTLRHRPKKRSAVIAAPLAIPFTIRPFAGCATSTAAVVASTSNSRCGRSNAGDAKP
jgi:hypothetical protein